MHGTQYLAPTVQPAGDELLHRDVRASAGCSRRCIRARSRSRSASSASAPARSRRTARTATCTASTTSTRPSSASPERDFTYLQDSEATIEIAARRRAPDARARAAADFDVLAIDAFSSDAIPVHLITSEALALYAKHMKPGGVIAFHVTNRFLNLVPVVEALARRARHAGGVESTTTAPTCSRAAATGCSCRTTAALLDEPADRRTRRRRIDARDPTGGCGPTTSTTCSRCCK